MSKRKKRPLTPEQVQYLVGRLRIGDLNKVFSHRYGGDRHEYVLADDDAGREDLIILLQHYSNSNPLKVPQIIKLRAPWIGDDERARAIDHIVANPRRWRAEAMGRVLHITKSEWQELGLRTIAPGDMTIEERKQERKLRNRLRMRLKRRTEGRQSRAEYVANSRSRNKPWLAAGMSRAAWYRRQAKAKGSQPPGRDKSVSHKDRFNAANTPVSPSQPPVLEGIA